jgi:hypothetical protein
MLRQTILDFSAAQSATLEILVAGIVGTLATDVWQRLLQTIASLPPPRWDLVGRWVAWIPRRFRSSADHGDAARSRRGGDRLGVPLCGRDRLRGPLPRDHAARLPFRTESHFGFVFRDCIARGALAHLATGARHGLFRRTDAKPCRGSHHQRVSARSFRARPVPRRGRLTRRGRAAVALTERPALSRYRLFQVS